MSERPQFFQGRYHHGYHRRSQTDSLIVYLAKLKAAFAVCLVTLYYYLCLTEAVRPMFVHLQQELHPGDIDAVVMRRKMT